MSPFLGRLGALGVDDRVTRARLSPSRLADRDIKRLVDTVQRAIPIPQLKIEMRRAFRRQIFRRRSINEREVLNAIFYVLATGCQWQALPSRGGRRGKSL
jgi:hypothetical protein